jgi:hypothetical protein
MEIETGCNLAEEKKERRERAKRNRLGSSLFARAVQPSM